MLLFQPTERRLAETAARLAHANPFVPERDELVRELLGERYDEASGRAHARHFDWELDEVDPNLAEVGSRVSKLVGTLRDRLAAGASAAEDDLRLYEDLVLFHLYQPQVLEFDRAIREAMTSGTVEPAPHWDAFRSRFAHFLQLPGRRLPSDHAAAHVFACFFQIRRGWYHVHQNIYGRSAPIARLRAAIWQSIFTHDLRRYSRSLHARMEDVTVLITGPSGTGKELVARAVGLSRYQPFDERSRTFDDFTGTFHPVNLSALPATLVESELFGHVKGAFTGAVRDREGRLELCEAHGTVFLDEIGELEPALQVKLLRVLQDREFQRIGETKPRRFAGKVIAATNRDLAQERLAGRFRDDLYYRLCSDMIVTPSLAEQLADSPEDLQDIVAFLARRIVGEDADELTGDVTSWIGRHLADHPWPGNFRELEQCVRNVMIRREYHPAPSPRSPKDADPLARFGADVLSGALTLQELESRYASLVRARTGSHREAARRLGCDWRTLKSKIDPRWVERLRST